MNFMYLHRLQNQPQIDTKYTEKYFPTKQYKHNNNIRFFVKNLHVARETYKIVHVNPEYER